MAEIVEFITPDKVILTGLWLGEKQSDTAYIVIHGLGGNVFSMRELAQHLVTKNSSVLLFNNRGHDLISRIKRVDKRNKKGTTSFPGGAAHEEFIESVDDIAGAVQFAQSQGAKKIILVGHSTGCQKAVYFAARKNNQSRINGIVLLSPLSDFAGIIESVGLENYENLLKIAKALVDSGNPHTLLPGSIWREAIDAQRFLSLYTPTSTEEIFSYVTPEKKSVYSKIKIPHLVIFGEVDEYRDRPVKQILKWFDTHQNSNHYQSKIIENGTHGFDGQEKEVVNIIINWRNTVNERN